MPLLVQLGVAAMGSTSGSPINRTLVCDIWPKLCETFVPAPVVADNLFSAQCLSWQQSHPPWSDVILDRTSSGPLLGGFVPTQLGRYTELEALHVCSGELSGTLPTEMGLLTLANELDFRDNLLSGTIPTQFGALAKLAARDRLLGGEGRVQLHERIAA